MKSRSMMVLLTCFFVLPMSKAKTLKSGYPSDLLRVGSEDNELVVSE